MASSPLRSPFKSIANCVASVLGYSKSENPGKNVRGKDKSRSVSPEIPKLEEPKQYTLNETENMNSSPDEKSVRRSTRTRSNPATPKTPRSIVRSLAFNDDPPSPSQVTRKSSRVRSTPATPSTPKGTPRSRRLKKEETSSANNTPEKVVTTPSRRHKKSPNPKSPLETYDQDDSDEDFKPGRRSKRATPLKATNLTPRGRKLQSEKKSSARNTPEKTVTTPSRRRQNDPEYQNPKTPESSDEEDSEEEFKPMTKGAKKGPGTPRRALPFTKDEELNRRLTKTPKRRKSSIEAVAHRDTPAKRRRTMTPRIPARSVPLAKNKSSLEEAQLRLHVGAVPESLPCREDEFAQILSFTEGKIFDGTGGCMYISGVPGTGKTATVKEVIRTLESYSDAGDLPAFQFIEINGMRLTEPNQLYAALWKAMTGAKVTTEHAKNLLEKRFTDPKAVKKNQTTVVLVDELDLLWNRKQSVLYNIFDWPNNRQAKLVILAIANTMDLPERVMINRVSSRIGLTRLTFSPYTHQQLQEIVMARLSGLTIFDGDAIQLVARKVASLSGDARRALDICRRATELAQRQGPETLVTIKHVTDAHKEMFFSPKILAIRNCSKYEKVFMQAMVGVFQKIGIEEAPFDRVVHAMNEVLKFEGLPLLSVDEVHNLVGRLSAIRLILAEPGKTGRLDMKLRLNVSQDDVLFALRE